MTVCSRSETVGAIKDRRVVAIVRASSAEKAIEVGQTLIASGLNVVEVALTTPNGLHAITELAAVIGGEQIVGAGTVLDASTAREAVAAGARFIVSPGLDERTVQEIGRLNVVAIPGAATATEVMRARRLGCDFIKLFPASTYGPEHLVALRAVFPDVAFVPTGGVSSGNAGAWFEAGAVAVAVGGALSGRSPGEIEREAQALLSAVRQAVASPG